MVVSELKYHQKYQALHPLFSKGFSFLENLEATNLDAGKMDIGGEDEIFAIVIKPGTSVNSTPKLEVHRKYIDIHFTVSGKDLFGWKPIDNCINAIDDFNTEDDYQLYNDPNFETVLLKENNFAIVFPEDAHVPCIETNNLTKIVLKVKV